MQIAGMFGKLAALAAALAELDRGDDLESVWKAAILGRRKYSPYFLRAEDAEKYAEVWRAAGYEVVVGDPYPDEESGCTVMLDNVWVSW